jgi:tRNA A-37 threonylcarbamoyl transferase component Bud32
VVRILSISKLADKYDLSQNTLLDVIKEMKEELEKEIRNILIVNDYIIVIDEEDILMMKWLLKDEKISLLDLMSKIGVNSTEVAKEILRWMVSKNYVSSEKAENVIKSVAPLVEVNIDKSEVDVGDYLVARLRIVSEDFIRPVNINVTSSEGLLLESTPISIEQIAPSEEGYYEAFRFRAVKYGVNTIEIKVKGKVRNIDFEKTVSRQVTVYPSEPKLRVNVYVEKMLFGRQADLNFQILNYGYGDAKDIIIKNPEILEKYFNIIQDIPKGQIIPPGDRKNFQVIVSPKRSGNFKIDGLILQFRDMMDRTYLSEPINFDVYIETPQPKIELKVSYPEQTRPNEDVELTWIIRNFGAEAKDVRIRIHFSEGIKFIRGYKDQLWPTLIHDYEGRFSSIVSLEGSVKKVIEKVEIGYTDIEGIQHSLILTGQDVGGDKPIKIGGPPTRYRDIMEFVRIAIISKPLEANFIPVKPLKELRRRIYDFEVYSILGKGGYGATLLATDRRGQNVVIKMPLELCYAIEEGREKDIPTISGEVYRAFSREVDIIRMLKHQHIIKVLDIKSERAIIVIEYCANGSLRTLLDNYGRLNLKTALTIAIQIGSALDHIHTNRILHLDIKPSNILFTSDGILKVSDFNLARLMDVVSRESKSKPKYTPGYAAPEQIYKDLGNLGPYTDLFSLAAVLYEMLSGRTPFNVENYERRVTFEIPKYIEGVPRELNELLIQTLSKKPDDRITKANEFIANLAEIYAKEYGW